MNISAGGLVRKRTSVYQDPLSNILHRAALAVFAISWLEMVVILILTPTHLQHLYLIFLYLKTNSC